MKHIVHIKTGIGPDITYYVLSIYSTYIQIWLNQSYFLPACFFSCTVVYSPAFSWCCLRFLSCGRSPFWIIFFGLSHRGPSWVQGVCMYVCLSVWLLVCLFVCLFVCNWLYTIHFSYFTHLKCVHIKINMTGITHHYHMCPTYGPLSEF